MQSIETKTIKIDPIKIIITGKYYDCQIYRGRLYLWSMDGFIKVYDWNKIINQTVIPKFKEKIPFVFSFIEGNFLYNKRVSYIFSDEAYRSVLLNQYRNLVGTPIIVEVEELVQSCLYQGAIPMDELPIDTEVYANNLYFALDNGLYRKVINSNASDPSLGPRDIKLWDCRLLSLKANKYPQIALSAGSEGLFELNLVKDKSNRPKVLESVEDTNIYRISKKPSSFSNYSFLSVFSSSYIDESYMALFKWKPIDALRSNALGKREAKVYRDFNEVIEQYELFGEKNEPEISWGIDDKIYSIKRDTLSILKFNNSANFEKGETYYQTLDSVKLPKNIGQIIGAGSSYFGNVLEFTKGVMVLRSDGNVTVIPGEVVRWRVYPRSKNYLNHLHLVYEDRLEIYSFNHDALVNQETKKIGIEYIPDEVPIYKSKSDSATAKQAGIFDNLVLKSGDFNEFNLDDTELPF